MSSAVDQSLAKVYALIEAEKLSEARSALEPLLKTQKDNAAVWWLYAHAVEEPATAQMALQNVLRLDPSYPGADELLQSVEQQGVAEIAQKESTDSDEDFDLAEAELDLELDDIGDDFEAESEKPTRRRGLLLRLGGLIAVIAIVILAVVLLNSLGGGKEATSAATPTAGAQMVISLTPGPITSPPATLTRSPSATPTSVEASTPSVEPESQAVLAALEEFTLFEPSVERTETDLGLTLLASVCMDADRDGRDMINAAMTAMARVSPDLADDVEAIGVRLIYCDTQVIFNALVVERDYAEAFANGALTEAEFRGYWRVAGN